MEKLIEFDGVKYLAVSSSPEVCTGCIFLDGRICHRPTGISSCINFFSPEETSGSRAVVFNSVD